MISAKEVYDSEVLEKMMFKITRMQRNLENWGSADDLDDEAMEDILRKELEELSPP